MVMHLVSCILQKESLKHFFGSIDTTNVNTIQKLLSCYTGTRIATYSNPQFCLRFTYKTQFSYVDLGPNCARLQAASLLPSWNLHPLGKRQACIYLQLWEYAHASNDGLEILASRKFSLICKIRANEIQCDLSFPPPLILTIIIFKSDP